MRQPTGHAPDNSPATAQEHSPARRVLLIEDNEIDAEIVRALVRRMPQVNWELHWAPTFEEGLTALASLKVDIALVDFRLDERTGADFIREARASGHTLPMVVVTSAPDPANDWHVFLAGAAAFVPKDSLTSELLERTIRYALRDPHPASYGVSGFVCVCIDCRRLRDSQERWRAAEDYLSAEPRVSLSHGLCPQCFAVRAEALPAPSPPDAG